MSENPRIDVEVTSPGVTRELSPTETADLAKRWPQPAIFGMRLTGAGAPTRPPKTDWKLTSTRPYDGELATGMAAVYLAPGHEQLTKPFIFADGFNYGRSELDKLWDHFDTPFVEGQPGFLSRLLQAGIDVVLLGFNERHTYIQANAGVAIACIQKAIVERIGDQPLIVGGVSMGGMITRYALAELEYEKMDTQTDLYVSYDTPHNGAWIPLILQQLAHFYAPVSEPAAKQSALLKSCAARQLLWGWVPDARTSGEVARDESRVGLLTDLNRLGDWPARPRLIGVANGDGKGMGRDLPPGDVCFDFASPIASAKAHFQPAYGEHQPVGGMSLLGEVRISDTSEVPPFDGAPGGVLESFGLLADPLGIELPEAYRWGCFVPSISAVALRYDPIRWNYELDKDISLLPEEESALMEFHCDENTEHSAVTKNLMEWLLLQLIK